MTQKIEKKSNITFTNRGENSMKKENENIIKKEVNSFQNELQDIKNTAIDWYNIEYTNSNTKLYSVFARLYKLYETCTDTTSNANKQKSKWLKEQCEKKGVQFGKKPIIQKLLINYAFFVEGVEYTKQQKRISSYVRVFTTATASDGVSTNNIADWIVDSGGIESIRQQTSSSAITKEQRIEEGTKLLNGFKTICEVSNDKTTQYTSKKTGEIVLLVGVLKADGSVAVKHTIFEKEDNSNIKGSTVIKTALCNVYSKHKETEAKETKLQNEAEAKEAKLQNAEKEATDKAKSDKVIIFEASAEKSEAKLERVG